MYVRVGFGAPHELSLVRVSWSNQPNVLVFVAFMLLLCSVAVVINFGVAFASFKIRSGTALRDNEMNRKIIILA